MPWLETLLVVGVPVACAGLGALTAFLLSVRYYEGRLDDAYLDGWEASTQAAVRAAMAGTDGLARPAASMALPSRTRAPQHASQRRASGRMRARVRSWRARVHVPLGRSK